MYRFTRKKSLSVVRAIRAHGDTSVDVDGEKLFGMPDGWWYIVLPDGTKKKLSHTKFIETYEPVDRESFEYLLSTEAAQ